MMNDTFGTNLGTKSPNGAKSLGWGIALSVRSCSWVFARVRSHSFMFLGAHVFVHVRWCAHVFVRIRSCSWVRTCSFIFVGVRTRSFAFVHVPGCACVRSYSWVSVRIHGCSWVRARVRAGSVARPRSYKRRAMPYVNDRAPLGLHVGYMHIPAIW